MGKFLKRSIRADVILESVSRSRGRMELKRKPSGEVAGERKVMKREGDHNNAGGGEEDPRMNPAEMGETEENLEQVQQESGSNWIEEDGGEERLGEKKQQEAEEAEEEEEEEEGDVVHVSRGTNSLLRASHSDSCLKRRDPIGGHSRSNSASFSHEQSLGLGGLVNLSFHLQNSREDQQFENTRESELEPCYNTLVLYEESQPSTISRTREDEELLEQREAPTPGSTSRQTAATTAATTPARLVRDCGPGWRHRSGAPTNDELEDFFATVESEKDDRERFIQRYNFDVLNDVPLPGRFEWESLKQT